MKTIKNEKGERIEDHENGIILNLEYWDCECEENYIQPISKKKCNVCGAKQTDMPSSRASEVKYLNDMVKN